jgi:HK97 family phage major capsid protein/HK97 family phage prohead protease
LGVALPKSLLLQSTSYFLFKGFSMDRADSDTQRAYAVLTVKAVEESKDFWTIKGIASTPTPDHSDDIVEPMGVEFKTPMPLLWQHDAKSPIGTVTFARATPTGIPFEARIPVVKEAGKVKDRIDEAVQSIKYKLVAGASIGFRGVRGYVDQLKSGGLHFKRWKWFELSVVTIADNSEAHVASIKSLDTKLRAASGHTPQSVKSIPASRGNSTLNLKGTTVKTLKELKDALETKSARMSELMDLKKSEARRLSADESAEFDGLQADADELEDEIRQKSFEERMAAKATPAQGRNQDEGRGSRQGVSFVKKTDPEDSFKGESFVRHQVAKALAFIEMKKGNFVSATEIAKHRWGKSHPGFVEYVQKAAVAGGGTGSGEWGAELAQSDTRFTGDFIEFLYSMTVFDRLPLRSVPARVHIKGQDGAATGYWVGESKAIPVSKPDFSDIELTPLKVGAVAVCSKELVSDSSPSAMMLIRDSIAEASAQRVDTTFLSATAASSGVSPAGLLNGLTGLVPSGADAAAVRADMMSLYSPFLTAKNASGLVQIMTPSMAKALALLVNALGQPEFVGLNANGGTLLGDPVYTGDNVTPGNWILMKPSDIWKIGDGGIEMSMTDTATIEQNDAPQGASDTPTAASDAHVAVANRVGWLQGGAPHQLRQAPLGCRGLPRKRRIRRRRELIESPSHPSGWFSQAPAASPAGAFSGGIKCLSRW